MKENISILVMQNSITYHFAEVSAASDGSLEIIFPSIKENTGISQVVQLSEGTSPTLLSSNSTPTKNETQYYISYHTSGKVNYHKMTFQPAFMEPLYDIKEKNTFFIYSFIYPEIAFKSPDNKVHSKAISIDISQLVGQRINIILSICPSEYHLQHNNSFVISYQLYGLCVEILSDETTFNFSRLYQETDCVKLRPHLDKFSEQSVTKEYAFLSYNHALYQTKDAIVLPPNGEGILKIIFTVEMRIPPWFHVEFSNPDFCAEVITRKKTHLTFKVFDRKHNQYIKKENDIKITHLILDAEIYEDDSIPPPGCI